MTTLALTRADPGQPRPLAALDHSTQLRFLLIEDSASDSELVRALLEDEFPNGTISVAVNLEMALRLLEEADYDVILADLTLPDADGEMVVRAVRRASPQTALMVLTGRVDGTLALWTLAEGAQDYLVKGVHDGPRLAEALLHGLQRSRTEQMAHARLVAALRLESEATERLRELDLAKNDFVAIASHELRTPLTSVVAYAELLAVEVDLTDRQREFVAVIVRNAARLTALTEDLLLLSALNSTPGQEQMLEVDMRVVVSSAEDIIETLARQRLLDVRLELPDDPVVVMGDARELERLVLNLMSNAIKFTPDEGTVTCRLSSTPTQVSLEVIDTGIGIPAVEQGQLFTRFFRSSEAHHLAIQGTGLGLHIAASIVKAHGGDISVDSAVGRGTTISVRLPAMARHGSDPSSAAPPVTMAARVVTLLGGHGDDPEVLDIADMLDAALEAASQTAQWELLGDALGFAHDRLAVRGLLRADDDFDAAVVRAAGARMAMTEVRRLDDLLAGAATGPPDPRDSPGTLVELWPQGAKYLELLLRGDRTGAIALARHCVTEGMDSLEILLDVLEPAQHEVGRRWAAGDISVVQEHFCTTVTQFVMADLYPEIVNTTAGARRLVAVHAHGSLHHVGLRIVADVLECRGWRTTYLVDDSTIEDVIARLTDDRSDLLLISASMPSQVAYVTALVRAVKRNPRTRGVKVVVGGRPFLVAPHLVEAVDADGWAPDARTAVDVCDQLTGGPGDH